MNAEFDRRIEADIDAAMAVLIAKVASEVIRILQAAALLADDQTLRGENKFYQRQKSSF